MEVQCFAVFLESTLGPADETYHNLLNTKICNNPTSKFGPVCTYNLRYIESGIVRHDVLRIKD